VIASLRGTLAATGKDSVVVDVGGVGFQVFVPRTLLDILVEPGQEVSLLTHLQVRENELALYGFGTKEELSLFRLLLTVSGIGPRVALSILSSLAADRLQMAIAQEDVGALSRVPGVGPKTARKLVVELKDRVVIEALPGELKPALTEADTDLIAALTTLGYSVAEVQEAIRSLPREPLSLEERVRLALAYFGS
jgi:Holliday junction DNA helicase RuvA